MNGRNKQAAVYAGIYRCGEDFFDKQIYKSSILFISHLNTEVSVYLKEVPCRRKEGRKVSFL